MRSRGVETNGPSFAFCWYIRAAAIRGAGARDDIAGALVALPATVTTVVVEDAAPHD